MSLVLGAVGMGLSIAGEWANSYRSKPPISVYRSLIARGFLEAWINDASYWKEVTPAIYPYENSITEKKLATEETWDNVVRILKQYNDKIVKEWGEDARLDLGAYRDMRELRYLWEFALNNELHIGNMQIYDVKTGTVYPIGIGQLELIHSQSLNLQDFEKKVKNAIIENQHMLNRYAVDNGFSIPYPNLVLSKDNEVIVPAELQNNKIFKSILAGLVVYFLIKKLL